MDMHDIRVAIGVELNWNPSYSYAKVPEGITNLPDYWRVLLTPVPPELGLPHIRNVEISGIQAAGAGRAFAVSSYADSPLRNFTFQDLDIATKTAGSIRNADGWKFTNTRIQTGDGSHVSVQDSRGVTGLD
jgi:hypothetical protein